MKILNSILFLFISLKSFSQWVNLNTGINDNLNGVVFFQENGIVSGENGIYYTTNGGIGSSSWTELHMPTNPSSNIFEDTKFTHCYGSKTNTSNTGIVYACGQTISENKAVIFKINIPTMNYQLIYHGSSGTKLNKIECVNSYDQSYAVGNNGLMLSFTSTGSVIEVITNTTEDLLSISSYNSRVAYGSSNKVWTATVFGNGLSDFGGVQNSSIEVKDICEVSSLAYIAGGNKFNYVEFNSSGINGSINNFNLPLNANAVTYKNSIFVGTTNGIYKYVNNCLEWQPSSSNFSINEFWFQTVNNEVYACGNNGLLLKTSNYGGSTKPYIAMNAIGTCVNGTVQFSAIVGSGNNSKWYIDNVLQSTNLTGFTKVFNSPGQYEIKLEVINNFNEVSIVTKNINIVNIPAINKPIIVSDTILCKAEAIQIIINDSETNVKYVLRKNGFPSSNFGESPEGNGGAIVLNSSLIDLTGDYYIEAVSTLANCMKRFDANFLITVEETNAAFHSNLINANIAENINFINHSQEANSYDWQFELNSQIQNSNAENVQISFPNIGLTTVSLEATSINGCIDVKTDESVQIVDNNSVNDTSFILGYTITDFNISNREIWDTKLTSDGYLNCGAYKNSVFKSRIGKNFILNGNGGFLAKHDKKGILKWMVYTNITTDGDFFKSIVIDNLNNIYISGIGSGYFYDNNGDKINLNNGLGKYFLIKLDPKGKLIWILQNNNVLFESLHINTNQYFIATTRIKDQYTSYSNIPIYKNGLLLQNIGNTIAVNDSNFGLIKFDFNANIIWENEIKINFTNAAMIYDLEFDLNNNIYLTNSSESTTTYYSFNGLNKQVLGNGTYGGKSGLAKYDSNGNCIWAIRTRTQNTAVYDPTDSTIINDLTVDDFGNIYVVGENECKPNQIYSYTHIFDNSDGSTTQTINGSFYFAKINTNGICEWIRTTDVKINGNGSKIIRENNILSLIAYYTSSSTIINVPLQTINNTVQNITHDKNNYLILKYSLDGELLKVVSNSGLNTNSSTSGPVKCFNKDQDDYYFLTRHLTASANQNVDFGMIHNISSGDSNYACIVKCKENDGVILFNSNILKIDDYTLNNLNIYPNPSNGKFKIDFENQLSTYTIKIYNTLGKLVFENNYFNSKEVELNLNLMSGIYFIKIQSENKQFSSKIIID